jgi:hypothetical protein
MSDCIWQPPRVYLDPQGRPNRIGIYATEGGRKCRTVCDRRIRLDDYLPEIIQDFAVLAKARELLDVLLKTKSYLDHGEGDEPSGLRRIDVLDMIDRVIASIKLKDV